VLVQIATEDGEEEGLVVGLVSGGLLKEAQVTGDSSLNKAFVGQFLKEFILLREVEVSDSLK
jgi:hypothetical protein